MGCRQSKVPDIHVVPKQIDVGMTSTCLDLADNGRNCDISQLQIEKVDIATMRPTNLVIAAYRAKCRNVLSEYIDRIQHFRERYQLLTKSDFLRHRIGYSMSGIVNRLELDPFIQWRRTGWCKNSIKSQ